VMVAFKEVNALNKEELDAVPSIYPWFATATAPTTA